MGIQIIDYLGDLEDEEPDDTEGFKIGFWLTVATAITPPVVIVFLVLWLMITVE